MDTAVEKHVQEIRRDGFTIIPGVIPAGQCEPMAQRILEVARTCRDETAYAGNVSFVPGLINHDQSFAEMIAAPRVIDVAQALLGPNVRISFTSAIINEPGKKRTNWHSDWPFNQLNAGHVPAPYPDAVMHLTSLVMVTAFTGDNGGTLVVPGSHRFPSNPTDKNLGIDPFSPYPTEFRVTGDAGSMLLFDSRLWHCPPANPSNQTRVALAVRYAPPWLNLEHLDPDSDFRAQLVETCESGGSFVPRLPRKVYDALPEIAKPLYRHWIEK